MGQIIDEVIANVCSQYVCDDMNDIVILIVVRLKPARTDPWSFLFTAGNSK